jgi:hypothetical protein
MYIIHIIMSCLNRRAYLADCSFLNNLIESISTIIKTCNISKAIETKKVLTGNRLEYSTTATNTDVVTLSIDGFIQYLYFKAYGSAFPEAPTPAERIKLYEIYDALKIPRPT